MSILPVVTFFEKGNLFRQLLAMDNKVVTILGNCVAERLLFMLHEHPGFSKFYTLKRFRIIPHIKTEELDEVARLAARCDIIFTQPLLRYGPCNTENLRKRLYSKQKMYVFSSPNFPAYFPDVCPFHHPAPPVSPLVMDWDSSIIYSCYLRNVPVSDVEGIYTSHWLFHNDSMTDKIEASVVDYGKREQGVDLSTQLYFIKNFKSTKLLHSPRHPVLPFLCVMRDMMGGVLGLKKIDPPEHSQLDFGQNQWPIITRNHNYFTFPEQDYFVISGQRVSIEGTARAYYDFYERNPHIVEANRHRDIGLEKPAP